MRTEVMNEVIQFMNYSLRNQDSEAGEWVIIRVTERKGETMEENFDTEQRKNCLTRTISEDWNFHVHFFSKD